MSVDAAALAVHLLLPVTCPHAQCTHPLGPHARLHTSCCTLPRFMPQCTHLLQTHQVWKESGNFVVKVTYTFLADFYLLTGSTAGTRPLLIAIC